MKKRFLTLSRETLTELTAGDLSSVAAGQTVISGLTCPVGTSCFTTAVCNLTQQPRCF
jgi:hypothetical protein